MIRSIHPPLSLYQVICELRKRFSCKMTSEVFRKSEAPAAERNKAPILEVLKTIIKTSDEINRVRVLEISSGTGQHVAYFAKHLSPSILWYPTEYDTRNFPSICAYIKEYNLENVAPPVLVDIREPYTNWNPVCEKMFAAVSKLTPIVRFKAGFFDYIYNSNLIHISSFSCTEGLFFNSGKLLKKGGYLITYGPYAQNGVLTPESNVRFDEGLRASDPAWGVRDIQLQLIPLAEKNNLKLINIIDMPSNNKTLVWEKQ